MVTCIRNSTKKIFLHVFCSGMYDFVRQKVQKKVTSENFEMALTCENIEFPIESLVNYFMNMFYACITKSIERN